jgi:phospholipase C
MATVGDLASAFRRDVAADALPAVSWLVAPEHKSEHPTNPPAYGEHLTDTILAR